MKKILLLTTMLVLVFSANSYAEDNAGHKLYRGIVNVVTAPIELPKQARAYWIEGAQKTDHILVWIGTGTVWGMVQGVKRAGSGLWDVVSFPFEKPENFEPLFKPEFVFDEWPRNPVSGR